MSIIIGIDHGYYAIKTAHCSFPAGLTSYGEHEPYTRQGLLEFGGCFFVCGSGRQPIQRDKTVNDNYYLLTLAAIAKEIRQRGLPPECSVRIAAGLPLTSFGRDKPKFKDYLLRSNHPVNFKFEGVEYSITIEEVAVFPQGYAALMTEVGFLQDEPSMLLMDLGGWTVDLMRIDNAIPAADTAHSLELGMIRCVDDIREQVRRETGLSLTDAQMDELIARIASLIRRYTRFNQQAGAIQKLNFDGLQIDLENRSATTSNGTFELPPKEFDLLLYCAKHQGKILTKQQIYEEVWGEEYFYDDSNIMAIISRLRKKLEVNPSSPKYIQTVKGIGYRFNKEV